MNTHKCTCSNNGSGMAHNHESQIPVMMRIISKKDLTPDVRFFQTVPTKEYRYENLDYKPGQFMSLSIPGAGDAPFSITSSPTRKGIVEFAVRKVGRFTEKLFSLKDGDLVGLKGPFGNGFEINKFLGKDIIIVAGGLGAAPLRSLLLYIMDNREQFGKLTYLYGARNVEDMLYKEDFFELLKSLQIDLHLIVDDDNKGFEDKVNKGRVPELFQTLEKIDPDNTVAAVCGPPVMYKFVVEELLKLGMYKNDIFLSLERRMKCGVGKCGHCIIDYVYTCIDGPVFTYWDVLHMKDLI
ncbi:MAG: FAD/NAD(P)-binding protein [Candidatus Cloacimonetes bacterium]|nr:FAD/NAD(P)-binding protein [Candidatus Cloacimonadota bacterium]